MRRWTGHITDSGEVLCNLFIVRDLIPVVRSNIHESLFNIYVKSCTFYASFNEKNCINDVFNDLYT